MLTRLRALQGEHVPRLATVMCVAGDLPTIEEFRAIPACLPLATHGNHRGPRRCARQALSQASFGHSEKGPQR